MLLSCKWKLMLWHDLAYCLLGHCVICLRIDHFNTQLHSVYTHSLQTLSIETHGTHSVCLSFSPVSSRGSVHLPSRDSQSCCEEGRAGRSRALYSNTTEEEMTSPPMATCSITSPVSWAGGNRAPPPFRICGRSNGISHQISICIRKVNWKK